MAKTCEPISSLAPTLRQSLVAWAESLRVDVPHQLQVTRLALQIFDETRSLHGEDEHARALLETAALLHDVGFSIDIKAHHKHSHDMILEHGIPGFAKQDARAVACVARYHRKTEPSPDHGTFAKLDGPLRETVRRLSAILRVADALDRSHQDRVRRITCEVSPSEVTLHLDVVGDVEMELYGLEKKKSFFEDLFKRALRVEIHEDPV